MGRPDRDAEDVGDSVERQVEVVMEDDHRAVVDGQPAEAAFSSWSRSTTELRSSLASSSSCGRSRRFGAQARCFRPSV